MRRFDFVTLDVFTDEVFSGNQLAVVTNADALSADEMQQIAREFNLSETVFVLAPADASNAARIRIFTPGYEMPFAGHPTVGAAIAIAEARDRPNSMRLELNTGVFPITLDYSNDSAFAEFENPNLPKISGRPPSAEAIERALSLKPGMIDRGRHAPRKVGAGVDFIYASAPLDAVREAKVDMAAFEALALEQTVGVLLYAVGGERDGTAYHVRMFAPGAGIMEDPATGSAAAALPGQIAAAEPLPDGAHEWIVEQGFEMGRPSIIRVKVTAAGGAPKSVRIGGGAVFAMRGQLSL